MIIPDCIVNDRLKPDFRPSVESGVVKTLMNKPTVMVLLLRFLVINAGDAEEPSIIPLPQHFSVDGGGFRIESLTRICLSSNDLGLASAAELFAGLIRQSSDMELPIDQRSSREDSGNAISLVLADRGLGDEGYELGVKKSGILITAKTSQGIFLRSAKRSSAPAAADRIIRSGRRPAAACSPRPDQGPAELRLAMSDAR